MITRHAPALVVFAALSILTAGCVEPFDVSKAELSGSLGEVRGFEGAPDRAYGFHDIDRSVVELESEGDSGWIVMTRMTVMGGLDGLSPGTDATYEGWDDVRLLGCSGPDGTFLFDRYATRVRVQVEPSDDPATRRVIYVGEWETDELTHTVRGSFEYVVPGEAGATAP